MTVVAPPTRTLPRGAGRRQLRVAHVVTQFTAGGGGITLRSALALDPERYSSTIFAPEEGGSLIGRAEAQGIEVVRLRHMATGRGIYPWADIPAIRELSAHLVAGRFDVVHTLSLIHI